MIQKTEPVVTICLPHWQVQELVTLCLRAIRKFTTKIPIEVIVVDNGSEDESLDYLRGLKWIRLIERRKQDLPAFWVDGFVSALDIGFAHCNSPYFIIMHTDTIVKRPDWLERMLEPMSYDLMCAASGAWKLELKNPANEFIKKFTDTKKMRLWFQRNFMGKTNARQLPRELCPRDYCALYRAQPIRQFGLHFDSAGKFAGYTAGEQIYYQLKEKGYHASVIETREMMQYMVHLAHATAGLRPKERRLGHVRAQLKAEYKIRRLFNSNLAKELMEDKSLDQ
jgi:glycosyltransferase involved in cell wall biosynthesis